MKYFIALSLLLFYVSTQNNTFQISYKELNMIILEDDVNKNFDFSSSNSVNKKLEEIIGYMQQIVDIENMGEIEKALISEMIKFDQNTINLCKRLKVALEKHSQIKDLSDVKSTVNEYIEVIGLLAKSEFIKHLKDMTKEDIQWDFSKQLNKLNQLKNRL